MSSVAVVKRIAAVTAELDALLAEPLDGLSTADRLAVTHGWETLMRRLPVVTHRLVAGLAQVPTEELGEPTLAAALATLLRISRAEAHRRIHEARELGPRCAVTGRRSSRCCRTPPPRSGAGMSAPSTSRSFGGSSISCPALSTSRPVRRPRRSSLGSPAGLTPEELRQAADRLAILLDQDGELCDGTGRGGAL